MVMAEIKSLLKKVLPMMYEKLAKWFAETDMGDYVSGKEQDFFNRTISSFPGVSVQLGMENWLRPSESCIYMGRDIRMDISAWAWQQASLDVLIMPHTLEAGLWTHGVQAERILAEAFFALKPEGRMIVTGFNPQSLWCLGDWFDGQDLPVRDCCLTLPNMKKKLAGAGFQIEQGQFMVYLPPVRSRKAIKLFAFLEQAGNRWWPHAAAVYGLVVRKRVAGVYISKEWVEKDDYGIGVVLGAARLDIK